MDEVHKSHVVVACGAGVPPRELHGELRVAAAAARVHVDALFHVHGRDDGAGAQCRVEEVKHVHCGSVSAVARAPEALVECRGGGGTGRRFGGVRLTGDERREVDGILVPRRAVGGWV